MKLVKHSTKRLSIRIWQMDLRFPGIILLLISGFFLGFASLTYEIKCDNRFGFKLSGCKLAKSIPLLYQSQTEIGTLKHVYIFPYLSHDGVIGVFYNIMLEGDGKKKTLLSMPTPGQYHKNHTTKLLKGFIKYSHKNDFIVPNPNPPLLFYIPLFLFLFALFMILRVNVILIDIDKDKNVIRIHWQNPFQASHRAIDISLLKTVDVQSTLTKKGKCRYRLAFFLKDREVIPFSRRYSYFFNSKRHIAVELNRFLNIVNIIKKGEQVKTDVSRIMYYVMIVMAVSVFIITLFYI